MRRGPLLMALAGIVFAVMNAAVKTARSELDTLEVMAWRSLGSLPLSLLFAVGPGLAVKNRRTMVLRATLGSLSMFSSFTALKGLTLVEISLVGKLQPIVVAALAPLVLGSQERVGRWVWGLLAAGLVGSALLLGPSVASGSRWGLWALASVVLSAGAHVAVRQLGDTEHPATIVFWFQTVASVCAVAAYVGSTGHFLRWPPSHLVLPLLLTGLLATVGQVLMTLAYSLDRAAVVAGAAYTWPVWALVLDLVAFGAIPDWHGLLGGIVLLSAGAGLLISSGRPGSDEITPPR